MSYVNRTLSEKGWIRLWALFCTCFWFSVPVWAQAPKGPIDSDPSESASPKSPPESSAEDSEGPAEEGTAETILEGIGQEENGTPIIEPPIEAPAPELAPSPDVAPSPPVESPTPEPSTDSPAVIDEGEAEHAEAKKKKTKEEESRHRFAFGSYGRVVAASNLNGSIGRNTNLVAYGSRIDEDVYAELELRREDLLAPGIRSKVVITLALSGPLFHFDGDFQEQIAIRNLFAEIDGALVPGLSLWAGSRMVRGDDVYLLNWWPLDNLNIVGGGAAYRYKRLLSFRLHVGIGRPRDPFYLQTRDVVARRGFDPVSISLLDRPRVVSAFRGTFTPINTNDFGLKVVLYGELHNVPTGERTRENGTVESLPSDRGYLIGAQIGLWKNRKTRRVAIPRSAGKPHYERSFVNLFVRYARGIAAYDTFDAPFRRGRVIETAMAREALVALSANFEYSHFGLQVGAYYRSFRDADVNTFGGGAFNEGAINLRPQVFFGDFAGVSLDFSYQALALSALDESSLEPLRGGVTKIGIIPFISLGGRGSFARPRIRLIYTLSLRDQAAQGLYPIADPRSQSGVEHFLGIGAEWWFDSSSYAL